MARRVDEWIGATDDQRAPPRVRERIFTRDSTCHLCKCEIQTGQKWDLDHVKALINGGENRETNLRPAHRKCHVEKTALDLAEKAKVAAIRKKHIGITRPKQTIKSAPFPKSEKPKKAVVYRPVTFYREDTP
ncbi:HNH endonuclease signature motif containing protein [Agrobacterium pusense]|uniref:HNH endonuclease n=1 Tax=Agrobacterium pusense TaxID=648995 RepID=UPI0028A0342F|nr:HNH endonuclease signature motif containing protein [Agrobacterium pusense]